MRKRVNRLPAHPWCRSSTRRFPTSPRGFMSKLSTLVLIAALACSGVSTAQPVRTYDDKGAPPFKVLKEGENPPLGAYDNFVIGPKYAPAPERKKVEGVPEGKVV